MWRLQSSVALDLARARPRRGGDFRVRSFLVPLFGAGSRLPGVQSAGCAAYCSYFSGPAFLAWHRMGNLQVGESTSEYSGVGPPASEWALSSCGDSEYSSILSTIRWPPACRFHRARVADSSATAVQQRLVCAAVGWAALGRLLAAAARADAQDTRAHPLARHEGRTLRITACAQSPRLGSATRYGMQPPAACRVHDRSARRFAIGAANPPAEKAQRRVVGTQVLPAFHGQSVSTCAYVGGVVCATPRGFRCGVIPSAPVRSFRQPLRIGRARTRAPHGGGRSRADDGPASRADACARMVCVQRSATAATVDGRCRSVACGVPSSSLPLVVR
jgi:hypothetical protein